MTGSGRWRWRWQKKPLAERWRLRLGHAERRNPIERAHAGRAGAGAKPANHAHTGQMPQCASGERELLAGRLVGLSRHEGSAAKTRRGLHGPPPQRERAAPCLDAGAVGGHFHTAWMPVQPSAHLVRVSRVQYLTYTCDVSRGASQFGT